MLDEFKAGGIEFVVILLVRGAPILEVIGVATIHWGDSGIALHVGLAGHNEDRHHVGGVDNLFFAGSWGNAWGWLSNARG